MKKIKFVLTILNLILSTLCFADSKYYIGSTIDTNFVFKKNERIILALPQSPTSTEKDFLNTIKPYLESHKFTLVDSIKYADRILTFRITENSEMNFESSAQTAWFQDLKSGMPSMQGGVITSNSKDSGYTFLDISLQDIGLIRSSKRSTIWQSFISTKSENFTQQPEVVLDYVMKMYGKNEVKEGKFKKPKK